MPADMSQAWAEVPDRIRAGKTLPEPWEGLFGALRQDAGKCVTIGQLGQSLDGRIATLSGHSHYINGSEGLAHLHRLRAVVDAVVVGANTVRLDDPQLTVRHVDGPNPVRVVIDPRRTLPATARAFAADGISRVLPEIGGLFAPAAILEALAARGLRRVLIEGGAQTVSHFLAAGCLDRLHIVVAPVILGSGIPGLVLPAIARMNEALRVPMHIRALGDEVLFDCDLSTRRSGQPFQHPGKLRP
jgi:riboflavin biosynthesis pyrimidine reductase